MNGGAGRDNISGGRGNDTISAGTGESGLADFEIAREIGRGAMGVVYEAVQKSLERRGALKILARSTQPARESADRFLREAQMAARLHHANIIPVFEAGEADGQAYYTMRCSSSRGQTFSSCSTELHAHLNPVTCTSLEMVVLGEMKCAGLDRCWY